MEQLKQGSKREAVYQYVDTRVSATLSEIIRALADNHKFSPDEKQRKDDIRRIVGQLVQEGRIIREDVDPPEYKTIQAKQQTETLVITDNDIVPVETITYPLSAVDEIELPAGITAKQETIYYVSDENFYFDLGEAIAAQNIINMQSKINDYLKIKNYSAEYGARCIIEDWEKYRATHKI